MIGPTRPIQIKLHEWFESKERLYLVFELAAGGELYERLLSAERFKEAEARDVAQALNVELHSRLLFPCFQTHLTQSHPPARVLLHISMGS